MYFGDQYKNILSNFSGYCKKTDIEKSYFLIKVGTRWIPTRIVFGIRQFVIVLKFKITTHFIYSKVLSNYYTLNESYCFRAILNDITRLPTFFVKHLQTQTFLLCDCVRFLTTYFVHFHDVFFFFIIKIDKNVNIFRAIT